MTRLDAAEADAQLEHDRRQRKAREAPEKKPNGRQHSDEARTAPSRPASWRDRFTLTLLADITLDDEPLWLIDG